MINARGLRPVAQVVLISPTYEPEKLLEPSFAIPGPEATIEEITISASTRLVAPAYNLAAVVDWMMDADLAPMSHCLLGSRTVARKWHGRYRILLGVPKTTTH